MRKLPDRVWRLPRQEDDEAAEEGIGRILALSDGVFAIALTLLILDIAVPATTSDDDLTKVLLDLWPRYLAFALSFLVISRFWVIHRQAFRLIVRGDPALVWLNLLLLLFISFLPFPTAVLGDAHRVARGVGALCGRGMPDLGGLRGLLLVRIRQGKPAGAGRRARVYTGHACP